MKLEKPDEAVYATVLFRPKGSIQFTKMPTDDCAAIKNSLQSLGQIREYLPAQ
jgi:hypothetical protein